ncbi:hypothetical protein [Sphingomonas echinoides]|uniref:hypothetical protein n=1 Tax=Sphingomonas echinoides TaxID=59803 RepID=UPI0024138B37|nr:hypothetical protein [Sphingomonas echinoides]
MFRLRMFAALVAIVTLGVMVLAFVMEAPIGVPIALLVAAACLAAITPFDAPTRRERNRVLIACLLYLVPLAVAVWFAHGIPGFERIEAAVIVLSQLGVGLICWAFATRKRRRMPQPRRYFDN